MNTLNVKPTNNIELTEKWGLNVSFKGQLFIRCNAKGIVNWEKSSVYCLKELLLRGDVNVIEEN